ncbi:phage integrase SAM-like domain-containing protein [Runella sp.]|uniref:phage integrase SAM-like domain-containing protein n=1 Tax=Runella sp. TaxID=1960881 RepID=UPI003D122A3B
MYKKKTKNKAFNTSKNNNTWKNNWKAFLLKEGILKIAARDITAKMGEKLIEFLQERIKSNSHISNHITLARKVMNKAIIDGFATWNPFLAITHSYESNFDPEGLEAEQVVKLLTCRHYTERQQKVVDAFLFMAASSMDHCDYLHDYWSLSFEDDRYWITYPRQKNAHRPNQPDAIPFVLDFGLYIWKKYGKDVNRLPRMSLPEMNRVIKVAARIAGVEFKKLTSKRARKTYANVCSNDIGLTDEALMYLMGHTTTKHLRAYRKIKRRRVLSELNKLNEH